MPSLRTLQDFLAVNIGQFERGKWDYVALSQLYPKLECLAQLVPRKETQDNLECTVAYQTETESTGHGAKPGDPIQPGQDADIITRKVKMVKYVDSKGWVLDTDALLGKPMDHIIRTLQKDLVAFDLHWWQDLEHMMLNTADNAVPADDENPFGIYGGWITDDASLTANGFVLNGGDDPYASGWPGGILKANHPKYPNSAAFFDNVSDSDLFDKIEYFLQHRKLMAVVPNPGLLPDTPSDVFYGQSPLIRKIQQFLRASNTDSGTDAGRYRGASSYKDVPFVLWHALGHPDSPVRVATCKGLLVDWNSFHYYVHSQYDRKIEGPKEMPYVPGGRYIQSEVWHQITCDRPDRNCVFSSDNAALQP